MKAHYAHLLASAFLLALAVPHKDVTGYCVTMLGVLNFGFFIILLMRERQK